MSTLKQSLDVSNLASTTWNRLLNLLYFLGEGLEALSTKPAGQALKEISLEDRKMAARKLGELARRLDNLQTSLLEVVPVVVKEPPRPPVPVVVVPPIEIPKPVPPPPVVSYLPGSNIEQPLDLSLRVLREIFSIDADGVFQVNLSRSRLAEALNLPKNLNLDQVVKNAIASAGVRWKSPPTGNQVEHEFVEFLSKVRCFLGDTACFQSAFPRIRGMDVSKDRIALN